MQPQNSQQALASLQQFKTGVQNPAQLLNQQYQQFGVNAAQQNVMGLRQAVNNTTRLLNNVAPGVMGRTGNSLVTAAQANRQIQNEQAPVAEQLSSRNRELGDATQDYNTAESQARNAANLAYQGQQDELSYLQNIYNNLYQREQDEADRAEAIRQFNETLAAQDRESKRAASASRAAAMPSFNLGGSTPTATAPKPQAGTVSPEQQKAYNDVKNLLTKDDKRVKQEYEAIRKSAGYGNAYDRLKLTMLDQLAGSRLRSLLGFPDVPVAIKNPYAGGNAAGVNMGTNVLSILNGK